MRNIYFMGQNKSIVLYPYQNQIHCLTLGGGRGWRPVIAANDYGEGLSDIFYRGVVYYCYLNRNGEIVIKNVTEQTEEKRFVPGQGEQFFVPELVSYDRKLLLLYFIYSPEKGTYRMCGEMVFEEKKFTLPKEFDQLPEYSAQVRREQMILAFFLPEYSECYVSERFGSFAKLKHAADFENDSVKLQQDFQKKLQSEQNRYAAELQKKDAVIESIKKQYEDLMDTAGKYREEAIKWRKKYLIKK